MICQSRSAAGSGLSQWIKQSPVEWKKASEMGPDYPALALAQTGRGPYLISFYLSHSFLWNQYILLISVSFHPSSVYLGYKKNPQFIVTVYVNTKKVVHYISCILKPYVRFYCGYNSQSGLNLLFAMIQLTPWSNRSSSQWMNCSFKLVIVHNI